MSTTNQTHVNFVKVPTMSKFEDLKPTTAGTIYFIVDAKKINLDNTMYGFNDADVADRFLELTGGTMEGDIDMQSSKKITRVSSISFYNDSNKIASQTEDGGMVFHAGEDGQVLLTLTADNSIIFSSEEISGIPAPVLPSSPISKEYLDTNVINKKGANNGYASLDNTGKVPSGQLPSYVDDVLEYSAKASFPETGESGKLYVDLSNNKVWRWSGSAYVNVSDGNAHLTLGSEQGTAHRGDHGSTAYLHSQLSGTNDNPHNINADNVGLGNVGNYLVADKDQAEAGASNTHYMTPQRTKNAIEKLAPKLSWTVVA